MTLEKKLANDMLIKGISLIGKARNKHRTSASDGVKILESAITTINDSIDLAPNDIGHRMERLKHFIGISINSPIELSNIINLDIIFFEDRYNELTKDEKSLFKFLFGQYMIFLGNNDKGISLLNESIKLSPNSLEALEAKVTIESIKKY